MFLSKRKREDNHQSEETEDFTIYRNENGEIVSKEEYFLNKKSKKTKVIVKQEEMFWGKGIVQMMKNGKNEETKETEETEEERDKRMRERIIDEEDPMAAYERKKRDKLEKKVEKISPQGISDWKRPIFSGQGVQNRFGIKPGHRWDGVKRGNGFENKVMVLLEKKREEDKVGLQ